MTSVIRISTFDFDIYQGVLTASDAHNFLLSVYINQRANNLDKRITVDSLLHIYIYCRDYLKIL